MNKINDKDFELHRKQGESQEQYDQRLRLKNNLSRIKNTIMVISGKGGVGKTTVAVNLAAALAREGFSVGLLDADIHGPNVALMVGSEGKRFEGDQAGKVKPVMVRPNLQLVSMAFLIEDSGQAVIWRGPLKMHVIKQFLSDFDWGDLDYLVVDLPPGTGDEPLSVAQLIPDLKGAVIVTTPQEVALLDGRKCVDFTRQIKVPVLGVIENMSDFPCPHCGKEIKIFGKGGGEAAARELNVPFLGRISLDPRFVLSGDSGKPFIDEYPDSDIARALNEIIATISDATGNQ
ncbi:MAG: Mrp/NBP35 family ATP-binding protein [Candidatus Auribacterota bacterium]|nr:Mrp/NBP35 family ATP-binding protein [Candidatus Auribacterota bacterium]